MSGTLQIHKQLCKLNGISVLKKNESKPRNVKIICQKHTASTGKLGFKAQSSCF